MALPVVDAQEREQEREQEQEQEQERTHDKHRPGQSGLAGWKRACLLGASERETRGRSGRKTSSRRGDENKAESH